MSIDKKVKYDVQGGVKNYLGKQKQVQAPIKWKSSPNHPETELAYITKAEKDLLVKKDLHDSLKGGVNRGPSGIMSLNGFGSTDESQNVSGSQMSAAEAGDVTGFAGTGSGAQLPPGVNRKNKTAEDIRSAFIAAGGGQRVNPGFFDSRNTVSPAELSRARAYNPTAFRAGRKNSFMDMLASGGILGSLVRGIGQQFGLGKTYNQPTYDMSQYNQYGLGGSQTPTYYNDLGNELAIGTEQTLFPAPIQNVNASVPTQDITQYRAETNTPFYKLDRGLNTLRFPESNPVDTQRTPSREYPFVPFNNASVDASTNTNEELLRQLLNTEDTGIDNFIDQKNESENRQQELLNAILTG